MKLIKKIKGNKIYFYLKYSFRENNKIITKDIYLGKKIPKNLKQIEKNLLNYNKQIIIKKLESIKKNFQEEWKKIPKSAQNREKEEIAIAFTYNTNSIEGSKITLQETRNILKDNVAPNKSLRDIKETEEHYKLFLKILEKKEPISIDLLLNWHNSIFKSTKEDIAGKFRDYLVSVGNYRAPDWQDIDKLMKKFIIYINNSSNKINPVELAAISHYKFEKIHPFGDGNGRIGRLIINYILWYNNYPMIIIEYKTKNSYYKALEKSEETFVRYFLRKYLSTHKKRIANNQTKKI